MKTLIAVTALAAVTFVLPAAAAEKPVAAATAKTEAAKPVAMSANAPAAGGSMMMSAKPKKHSAMTGAAVKTEKKTETPATH